jgi:hypothetical protein
MNPEYPVTQPPPLAPPELLLEAPAELICTPALGWLQEGLHSAFFLRPRWARVSVGPWGLAAAVCVEIALGVLMQWAVIEGAALFYWRAIASGWLGTVLVLWGCWLVSRHATPVGPGAASLFAVALVPGLLASATLGAATLALVRWGYPADAELGRWLAWACYAVMLGWPLLAAAWMLCRHTSRWPVRGAVLAVLCAGTAVTVAAPAPSFWYPDEQGAEASAVASEAAAEFERKRFVLSQTVMEAQSIALIGALDAVQPQRPGVADVYAITFAPVADEDVFSREAGLVTDLMRQRFDAEGRTLRLQNHAKTASELPWATPLNLQRAITRMAERMDRDEDVLFIHLTSHGGKDGHLAANFWPLEVGEVTPEQLKAWLDAAGVRNRVISVSACYAGSWIAPLAGPSTLVMTAADADHTSYGCGRKSELTFFGRAMYAEQLRLTHSFEAAHAAARPIIEKREQEAGKNDGYSNPQINVGEAIRPVLKAVAARLGD